MPTSTSTHVGKSVYSSMHVLVSTYSTSYPIAKGTYPIAKVMLRKQGSIPKQSIVAYLQDTLHNSDSLHIANRALKTRLYLSWHHLWDAILSRVWCLMTNRPKLEQIRAD